MAEQTKNILSQIDGFLALAGTDKTKLLSANIWITDMANFTEMNGVWDSWVWPGNTPARATVEAKLASPDYKVEIFWTTGPSIAGRLWPGTDWATATLSGRWPT